MYGNRGFGNSMSPPVKEGEEVEVSIEAVGEKGDGIAKVQGFVLFVPNTKTGDNVKVRVTRVLSKVGFADVIGQASGAAPAAAEAELLCLPPPRRAGEATPRSASAASAWERTTGSNCSTDASSPCRPSERLIYIA